ncbi:MAG: ribosome maturation factor RimP [Eubacteriales bacterium]|nr:ribosome maturation factor RimP [Eubacteriales bacterium]
MNNNVADAACAIVQQALENTTYELVDLEFKKERSGWNIIVYADKPEGLTLDDCEAITHLVDPLLDASADVSGKHDHLIVSSPGLDRPLKTTRDFTRRLNEMLDVRLFTPYQKKRDIAGVLTAVDDEHIYLKLKGSDAAVAFPRADIALARLRIEFD